MPRSLSETVAIVEPQLEALHGMTFVYSQVLQEGFRFVYEDTTRRVVVLLTPRVYTNGAVINDPINDLVLVLTVTTYDLAMFQRDGARAVPTNERTLEMPYSTWFFEGNYR